MSNKAVGWAWEQVTDRPIDKMVLVALADYAGKDGYSYPSHRELAGMAQCSTDSVQRCLKRLVERGLLIYEKRLRDNGGQSSNGYTIVMDGIMSSFEPGRAKPKSDIKDHPPLPQNAVPPLPQNAVPPLPQNAVPPTAPVRYPLPQCCGTLTSDLSIDPSIYPSPPSPSESVAKRVGVNGDNVVQKLRATGEHLHVVEGLIEPLWGAIQFKGGDPDVWLRSICVALTGRTAEVIDKTCDLIRTRRSVWPTAAQAVKLADEAYSLVPLIQYPEGSIPFRAWCEHYRHNGMGSWARKCEERGYVAERGPVPPSRKRSAA